MIRRLPWKPEWKSIRARTMVMLLCVNAVIILLLSLGAFRFYRQSFVDEIASARSDVRGRLPSGPASSRPTFIRCPTSTVTTISFPRRCRS